MDPAGSAIWRRRRSIDFIGPVRLNAGTKQLRRENGERPPLARCRQLVNACWPENCRFLDRYSWDSFLSNSRTLFCRSERFFITAAFRA
jgi:hypothetical protein